MWIRRMAPFVYSQGLNPWRAHLRALRLWVVLERTVWAAVECVRTAAEEENMGGMWNLPIRVGFNPPRRAL